MNCHLIQEFQTGATTAMSTMSPMFADLQQLKIYHQDSSCLSWLNNLWEIHIMEYSELLKKGKYVCARIKKCIYKIRVLKLF